MSQVDSQSLKLTNDTPRSVNARMAMMAMNDMGQQAAFLPAALAGRSDQWVRNFAKRILEIHNEISLQMSDARAIDSKIWKETFGERFEESVQKGLVPGAKRMIAARQQGGIINLSPVEQAGGPEAG